MKVFPVIFCCALFLAVGPSVWAAAAGSNAPQGGPALSAPTAAPASPATAVPVIQPRDKNGNPMTPEEFNRAADARMQARMEASIRRLEARQARWKKNSPPPAAAPK